MTEFARRLKEAREASGLSQGQVADKIGELRTNYNKVENGTRPLSDEKLQALAAIPELGLDILKLKAWKALDKFTPEELNAFIDMVIKEKERKG